MLLLGWTNRKINVCTYVSLRQCFKWNAIRCAGLKRTRYIHIDRIKCMERRVRSSRKCSCIAKMQMQISYFHTHLQAESADAPT